MDEQMELDPQLPDPGANTRSSPLTVPQKRKKPPGEGDFPPGTFASTASPSRKGGQHPDHAKGEYATGRVVCEGCGEGISFRDDDSGQFTVKHWDAHRLECPNAAQQTIEPPRLPSEPSADPPALPQAKRRRAKRTEDERIDYLRTDPYVAQFEAYRVLCASCDKWIRLRPNSTYCSIPWDAHRKSCLAKRVAKNTLPGDDRTSLFSNDPYVRKFDSERVQCKNCDIWITLGTTDNMTAIQTWMQHRASCLRNTSPHSNTPATAAPSNNIPTIDSVPPPSRHLMALVSSSAIPAMNGRPPVTSTSSIPSSVTAFKDYNPSNFPPPNESRRRNAEQRAAALRSDPLIIEVEPNRVFCSLCQKWVQLRQDSSYCAYPWLQHRGKCLNKQLSSKRGSFQGEAGDSTSPKNEFQDDSEDPESEEGVEGADDEEKRKRKAARQIERKRAKAGRLKEEERRALLNKPLPPALAYAEGDEDAEGEPDIDYIPYSFADLDTPPGRLDFIFRSVRYLFRTSYERTDELTIATLVTYLNAAMPPDKHEDYDTTEVIKAAIALHERGDFVFEGDVLRIPD